MSDKKVSFSLTPLDALELLITSVSISSMLDRRRPGHAVERAPKAWREALSQLTSDEALTMRVDARML